MTTPQNNLRLRFAPSPTGHMHVGHLRAALPSFLLALKARAEQQPATLILRFEDSDFARNKTDAEPAMIADLAWLGLAFDEGPHLDNSTPYGPYRTIERADRGDYTKAVAKLIANGRAYECFTTPEELDLLRKIQTGKGEPPHYDNRHRALSAEQKQQFRDEGRQPVIRFKLSDEEIIFEDLIRGTQKFKPENLGGDPVIVRSSGLPLFTFYGCVDDIAMAITHVIRGEDHITNAAVQVQMYQALGATPPQFAHVPLMLDKDGHKMSKRLGALTIAQLREQGFLPNALLSYLASLGLAEAPRAGAPLPELAQAFDFARCGKAPVRFDDAQLAHINTSALHHAEWADVQTYAMPFLPQEFAANPQLIAQIWPLLREGLNTLADIPGALTPLFAPAKPTLIADDQAFIQQAITHLPATLDDTSWAIWVAALKTTGRKGKALFMPLRLALTGQEHGPELAALLPIWGHAEVLRRLTRAAA